MFPNTQIRRLYLQVFPHSQSLMQSLFSVTQLSREWRDNFIGVYLPQSDFLYKFNAATVLHVRVLFKELQSLHHESSSLHFRSSIILYSQLSIASCECVCVFFFFPFFPTNIPGFAIARQFFIFKRQTPLTIFAVVLLLMYLVRLVVFFNVVFIQQPCFGTTIPRDLIPCSILFTFVCIFIMYKLAVKNLACLQNIQLKLRINIYLYNVSSLFILKS